MEHVLISDNQTSWKLEPPMIIEQLMTVKQLLEIRQLITKNQLLEIQQLMKPLMTVDTNTFPVHVYFTFVHDLIINVALNNIVLFKLLKRCVAIYFSKFCASSHHNDIASLEENKFRFLRCNINSRSFDAISIHHTHTGLPGKWNRGLGRSSCTQSNFSPTHYSSTNSARFSSTLNNDSSE